MRLLWLHKPHPCKACGAILDIAYPTCATKKCRTAWRRTSWLAAQQARRQAVAAAHRCARCKRALPPDSDRKNCKKCRKANAATKRKERADAAFRAYQEKIALARAERHIKRKVAQQAADEEAERERLRRETREAAARGWTTTEGDSIIEEI